MSYTLSLEYDIKKTDPNRLLGRNQFAKHKVFKQVKTQILKLTLGKRPPSPLKKFQISAIRYSPKFMDYDNMISSLKPAIDGLTMSGVIQDDSWEYIRSIEVDQVKSKEKKIQIIVKEIE